MITMGLVLRRLLASIWWVSKMCCRVCSNEHFIKQHVKNKQFSLKKWARLLICAKPVCGHTALLWLTVRLCSKSSDAASLHALELLMNEFFNASTNNHRKREIGIHLICKDPVLARMHCVLCSWKTIETWYNEITTVTVSSRCLCLKNSLAPIAISC